MAKKKYRKLKKKDSEADKSGGYLNPHRERRVITPEQKKEYIHLFLYLILWSLFLGSIYITCNMFEFRPILWIYYALGIILFFVYIYFNGGIKRIDPLRFEKPEDMGYDEFNTVIENMKARQKKSKYFLILFIPFPMIFLIDYVIIAWGDKLG